MSIDYCQTPQAEYAVAKVTCVDSLQFDPLSTEDKKKRGVNIMHCQNESPTLLFFHIWEKMDPLRLPIYKTFPKTVFRPCLQSELENKSQGKSDSVKKLGTHY